MPSGHLWWAMAHIMQATVLACQPAAMLLASRAACRQRYCTVPNAGESFKLLRCKKELAPGRRPEVPKGRTGATVSGKTMALTPNTLHLQPQSSDVV
jgi:hypothetical protein